MRISTRPLLSSVTKTNTLPIRGFATQIPSFQHRNKSIDPPAVLTAAEYGSMYDKQNIWGPSATSTTLNLSASWHLPDVTINERASRLSPTINLVATHLRGAIFVAIKGEVKGNPTESEADVAADRNDDDPLPPEKHHTIQMPAGDLAPKPTETEECVRADHVKEDLFPKKKK